MSLWAPYKSYLHCSPVRCYSPCHFPCHALLPVSSGIRKPNSPSRLRSLSTNMRAYNSPLRLRNQNSYNDYKERQLKM